MADMGFLPQVATILKAIPRERQTMLFSATLDSQIMGLISQTQDPLRFEVDETQPTVEGVEHHLFEVHQMDKTDVLIALLKGPHGLTLVFTRTKRVCDCLSDQLKAAGVNAEPIHGDLAQGERERALQAVRGRQDRRPRRNRRRRARARHRQHHARRELRPAGGPQGVPAPRRTHGASRTHGHRGHARDVAGAYRTSSGWRACSSCTPHIVEIFSSDPRLSRSAPTSSKASRRPPRSPTVRPPRAPTRGSPDAAPAAAAAASVSPGSLVPETELVALDVAQDDVAERPLGGNSSSQATSRRARPGARSRRRDRRVAARGAAGS